MSKPRLVLEQFCFPLTKLLIKPVENKQIKFHVIGNAALAGASMMLLNNKPKEKAVELAKRNDNCFFAPPVLRTVYVGNNARRSIIKFF